MLDAQPVPVYPASPDDPPRNSKFGFWSEHHWICFVNNGHRRDEIWPDMSTKKSVLDDSTSRMDRYLCTSPQISPEVIEHTDEGFSQVIHVWVLEAGRGFNKWRKHNHLGLAAGIHEWAWKSTTVNSIGTEEKTWRKVTSCEVKNNRK